MGTKKLTQTHSQVLAMAEVAMNKVSRINDPVDPHKRYNSQDLADPYGEVIEWVYNTGSHIFAEARNE